MYDNEYRKELVKILLEQHPYCKNSKNVSTDLKQFIYTKKVQGKYFDDIGFNELEKMAKEILEIRQNRIDSEPEQ